MLNLGGAGDRSRTYDLRITNALLYQLSYTGRCERDSNASRRQAAAPTRQQPWESAA